MAKARPGSLERNNSTARDADRAWDRELTDLADLVSDWVWETDAEHRLTYTSDRSAVIMGVDLRDFLGKKRSEFAVGSVEPGTMERHLEDLEQRRPFRDFVYATHTVSGIRYVSVSGRPLFDEDGTFLGYRGIATNVTRRVLAEQQAEIAHQELVEAIESLSVGFAHYDAEDRLVLCNSAYRKFNPGLEKSLAPGARFQDMARAIAESGAVVDARGRSEEWLAEMLERRRNLRKDYEWQLSDGRWVMTNDFRTARGDTISVLTDITELREREDALRQSERRFAMAFQLSPSMTAISDIESGRHVDVNDKWVEIMGRSREEAIGRTSSEMGIWADPKDRDRVIERLKQDGRVRNFETRYVMKSGEIRDFEVGAEIVPLDGKDRMLIVGYDVTDRNKAEEELRRGELRLSGILRLAMEAVIAVDDSQRITLFNDGAQRIFGYSKDEAIGESLDILLPENVREQHRRYIEEFGKAPDNSRSMSQRGEITGRRKDGAEFPAQASIAKLTVGGEQIFTVLLHDITQRKEAEKALLAAKEEAEVANRAKSEFLANMSHELRTPLNAILGFSQVIGNSVLGPVGNEKYLEYASDIRASGEHLLDIIGDILDLARIEAGRAVVEEDDVDIDAVVETCMKLVRDRALETGIELTSALARPLPRVRLDRRKLEQILINLLSNAVKFTERGGEITIEARAAREGGIVLTVRDTGIGMRQADIARALEPFTQIERTMTRRHEGTGLGLPLVKSLSELLGAGFEIDSTPGKGTEAKVYFPAERVLGPVPKAEHFRRRAY